MPRSKQTHCMRGHEYSAENTLITSRGDRHCRTCDTERRKAIKAKNPSNNPHHRWPADLSGLRFSWWTVIRDAGRDKHRHAIWECRCDCGNVRAVTRPNLVSSVSRSCGCQKGAAISRAKTKHGRDGSDPTYGTWLSMRSRCSMKSHAKYPDYGKRGIKVCAKWSEFPQFLKDMGERPPGMTLDRIDPNGNYEPSNCRWATPKQQRHNQRCMCPLSSVYERLPELLDLFPLLYRLLGQRSLGPQRIVQLLDSPMEDEVA